MPLKERYLVKQISKDIKKKMVFIGGPRQVGKTTMSKAFISKDTKSYLNWDIAKHREMILKNELPDEKIWVFDEIHKFSKWRNFLKGVYDEFGKARRILVTGSAKLDYYKRGGDSLQGRYHYLRMHPLSVAELGLFKSKDYEKLFKLGGFPEPYFGGSEIEAKRWSREYRTRLIQEDLVNLENVKDLGNLELLMIRLPNLVGSKLSINSLREDLQVSHKAVSNWLNIFESLYAIFRLSPFGSQKIKAIKKDQKHYHYDWSLVEDAGARFENMVASHLLKWVHFEQDTKARDLNLTYFRDIDEREVDFVVTEKDNPILAIECKYSDSDISKHLTYFKNKFPKCDAMQLSFNGSKNYVSTNGIKVCNSFQFLQTLI